MSVPRITVLIAVVAALVLAAGPLARRAEAHERRTVGGYVFVVGFLGEPAIQGVANGIDLRISNGQSGDPVEGVEKTLKADLMAGGQTKTMALRARFGMKGAYTADLIPTMPGTYTFRFYGTIDGNAVDETFTSGPGTFGNVDAASSLQFPALAAVAGSTGAAAASDRPAVVAQVAIAAFQIDNAGLHELDESLAKGTIPLGALGKVQNARIVAQATAWPAAIQPAAKEFIDLALTVEAALKAEDAARAAPAAHDLHETGHELTHAAYGWLATIAGGAAPAPDDD